MLLTPQNKRLATTITILCIIYSIKPKSSVLVFDTLINIMEVFFSLFQHQQADSTITLRLQYFII